MKTTLYIFALTLGLISCSNTTIKEQNMPSTLIKQIKVSELNDLTKVNNTIFLDVRTDEEFSTGFIPDAIHINYYDDNFENKLQKLDKTKSYVVYCKSGMRSQKASELMKTLGFKSIYNLTGGYSRWKSSL